MRSNSWGRIWGVLTKPGETFAAIAEQPAWAAALLVLVAVSAAATIVLFNHFDLIEAIRQQVAAQHQTLPPSFDSRAGFIKGCWEVAVLAAPAIICLVAAAIFLILNLFGGQLSYRTSFAVAVHAAMPQAIRALLTIPIAASRGALSMAEIQSGVLRSNLAFLAPEGAARPLVTLLASLDLFSLWNLVLLAIGYRIAARVSRTTAVVTVFLTWAILVACGVGFSALGGGRGNGRMKRFLIGGAVVVLLAAIVVGSLRAGKGQNGAKVYAEAVKARDVVQVVKASGEIDPKEKVNISAHVVGKIDRLYVQEGDDIRAGQPFLQLEQQAYIAARDQWAAELRSSQTGVAKAQAMLADDDIKVKRARRLHTEGILSKEQLDSAELATTAARLELDTARDGVRQAKANLDKVADDLVKTTIYAPISGRVIKLNAEQGEVVVSGTMNNPGSVIGTIADLSAILAKVDVDETEIVNIRVGQTALLKVDAVPARQYHGKVIEVGSSGASKASQPDVTFFEVKIQLADADPALRPGMSVRAEIRAAQHPSVLSVPIQAVVERAADDVAEATKARAKEAGKGAQDAADPAADGEDAKDAKDGKDRDDQVKVVFVVEAGKARLRAVTTGLADETHVELLSGLKPGERVVTGPYRTLRDLKEGDRVAVSATSESEDLRREGAKESG